MRSQPLEAITSPVTVDQLRSWLAYPDFTTDESSLAEGILKASAELVVNFTGHEIEPRKRRLVIEEWPTIGQRVSGIDPVRAKLANRILIPFGPVIEIVEVREDGDVVAASEYELEGDRIDMTPRDDLEIDYQAGYDDVKHFLPEPVRHAVLTIATWKWHHRGDAGGDPLRDSGAREMLIPFKVWAI